MRSPKTLVLVFLIMMLGACAKPMITRPPSVEPAPSSGVFDIGDAQLVPEFWIARLAAPDAPVLTPSAIAEQNARLLQLDASMHDLGGFPATLEREQVQRWIAKVSSPPRRALYDHNGEQLSAGQLAQLARDLDLDAIPATQATRFAMTVRRTSLRAFPTDLRAFSARGDTDIDRFQESALFPGTPLVIAHRTADGKWSFVVSGNYAAWLRSVDIAEGTRESVLAHAARSPFRIVTGARVTTVFTPESPRVSELALEMGSRLPQVVVQQGELVNGQHPYATWPVSLPVRTDAGRLEFVTALLQKNADSRSGYLAHTQANIIRQAFKFLGERYGWGHSYNGRDCSGFVSEVYRSMGIDLPRNTSDQGASPALNRTAFQLTDSREKRRAAIAAVDVGDLVYIPGHVMMVIGRIDGRPYVIHDTNGGSYLRPDGTMASLHLNSVSVTPLEPLQFSPTETYIDRMTSIVRIRP